MARPHRAIIVMAKEPRPGTVKTRLAPALQPALAAGLYRAFLLDVLDTVATLPETARCIFAHPPESLDWFRQFADGRYAVLAQEGPDLAQRMIHAFAEIFRRGYREVVMRNSDSPTLPAARLLDAFAALGRGADVVLEPDRGGGYCLVGLRAPRPELFGGVPMGGAGVLAETLRRARASGLSVAMLPPWLDVDTPADLEELRRELAPGFRGERAECERTAAFLATLGGLRQGFPSGPGAAADEGGERAGGARVP